MAATGRVLEASMQLEQHVTAAPSRLPGDTTHERRFRRAPESISEVRRFVKEVYADLDQDPMVCVLLVSEAATNAVRHAQGADFKVRITTPDMRVEVWDASHVVPIPMGTPRPGAESGRGLGLIGRLSSGMQWSLDATGKTLTFTPASEDVSWAM
ncbi:ATP-binding protein [Streptomyces sp. NPDC088757]|uniref:ATP-binding protein n=1 Tax=Streptomyces sp. NPDC088757 TaxID=3365889 RepID=UPI00382DC186